MLETNGFRKNFTGGLTPAPVKNRQQSVYTHLISLFFVLTVPIAGAFAKGMPPKSWAAPISGNWNDPVNWMPTGVPMPGDSVLIEVDGDYTVTINAMVVDILDLTLGGNGVLGTKKLELINSVMNLDDFVDIQTDGWLELTMSLVSSNALPPPSELGPATPLTNDGVVVLQNISGLNFPVLNNGSLFAKGFNDVFGPLTNTGPAMIVVEGTDMFGDARLTCGDVTGLANGGTVDLTAIDNPHRAEIEVSNGPLNNTGQILSSVGTGGNREIRAQLVNDGLVQIDQQLTLNQPGVQHFNNMVGVILLNSANFVVMQSGAMPAFTNDGDIQIGAGLNFSIRNGEFNLSTGMIGRSGSEGSPATIDLENVNITNGTLSNQDFLILKNCSTAAAVTVDNNGEVIAHGTNNLMGPFNNNATGILRIEGFAGFGASNFILDQPLTNQGEIRLDSPTTADDALLQVNGTLTNTNTGMIISFPGTGGNRTIDAPVDNNGNIQVNETLVIQSADLDHNNRGVIDIFTDGLTVIDTLPGAPLADFHNLGLIDMGLGTSFTAQDVRLVNDFDGVVKGVIQGNGNINVQAGDFFNAGVLFPGASPGVLNVNGDMNQTIDAETFFEIGGLVAGNDYDQINITGNILFGGLFDVTLINAFEPNLGDTFQLINFGSANFDMSNVTLVAPGLDNGLQFVFNLGATGLDLEVQAVGPVNTTQVFGVNLSTNQIIAIEAATASPLTMIDAGLFPATPGASRNGDLLYVPNSGDGTVTAIDARSDMPKATIFGFTNPQGVAFTADDTEAWVVDAATNSIGIVDTMTHQVSATLNDPCFNMPIAIAINPVTHHAYVVNNGNGTVCVYDTLTRNFVTSVNVGGEPRFAVVLPDGSEVYISNTEFANVSRINAVTFGVVSILLPFPGETELFGTQPERGVNDPWYLDVNADGSKVYVTVQTRQLYVIDTSNDQVTKIDFISSAMLLGLAIVPEANLGYVSDVRNNNIWLLDLATDTPLPAPLITDPDTPGALTSNKNTQPPPMPGEFEFSTNEYTAAENELGLAVTVTRVNGSDGDVTVNVTTQNGTAQAGSDYSPTNQVLNFPSGDGVPQAVNLGLIDDDVVEDTEDFFVNLSILNGNASLGDNATARVIILDDDIPANPGTLSLSRATYNTGEGSGSVLVTVERTGGAEGQVGCTLSTAPGSAQAGSDYTNTTVAVVFPNGDLTPQQVSIPIIDDNVSEGVEQFEVVLSAPTGGAGLGVPDRAIVAISDDDIATVSWETTEQTVTEGTDGAKRATTVTVTARLSNPVDRQSFASYRVGGTASSGLDFQALSGRVGFSGNVIRRDITITIIADDRVEADETIVLTLSLGNVGVGEPSVHTVTILDDDGEPVVNWDNVPATLTEGVGPTKQDVPVMATASLDRPSDFEVQVPFSVGGSALLGTDHDLEAGTLVFPPGEQTAALGFQLLDDQLAESPKILVLTLEESDDAVLGDDAQRVISILDDDELEVRWRTPAQVVTEDDNDAKRNVPVSVTAVLNGQSADPLEVPFFVGGTADAGADHDLRAGVLRFAPGETSANLQFQVLGDTVQEATEIVALTLGPGDARLGRPSRHVVSIQDNDFGQAPETRILRPANASVWNVDQLVPLEAAGTDPQDDPLMFTWEICGSTGNCSLRQGRVLDDVRFAEPGIKVITCYASDAAGNVDPTPAQVQIAVRNNIPPTVTIVEPAGETLDLATGQSFNFRAEVSDPDSENVDVFWFLISDPNNNTPGLSITRAFNRSGDFTLACAAHDDRGGRSVDWVNIHVSSSGESQVSLQIDEPTDRATVNVGDSIQFLSSINATEKRRDFRTFWDLGDGRVVQGQNLQNIVYDKAGRYFVRAFAAEDDTGQRLRAAIVLFVVDPTQPPVVDIDIPTDLEIQPASTAKRADAGEVFFKAFTNDSMGYPQLTYFWDFGDGRRRRQATPGRLRFEDPGVYTVSLYGVTPAGVQSDTVTRTITVRRSDDARFEPNEDFDQAAEITPGNYENLLVDDDSTTDIYRVEVPANGQRLTIRLDLDDIAQVDVFDADRNLVNSGTVSLEGSLQTQGLAAGAYFVRIATAPNTKKASFGYSLGVSVLNPALYFPEIQVDEAFDTQLGMVNTTGSPVSLEAIGYDATGNILARVPLSLPGQGRCHQGVGDLFGALAEQVAWVQVDADRDLVGYSRTESRDFQEVYGLSASKKLSAELFVPHIAEQVEQWFTRATVVNGSDQALFSQIQTPTTSAALDLDQGFASDSFEFLSKFGGDLPSGSVWAQLKENGENLAMAGAEVFGTLDGTRIVAGLELADIRRDNPNFTYIANNLYFTHIARDVANFYTGIALVNIGEFEQGVRITGYGPGGEEVGQKTMILQAGEKLVQVAEDFLADIGSPANVDWVLVEADFDIVGFELFGTHDGRRLAGLEATTALRNDLCFPFIDEDPVVVHGISVVNVNAQATTVSLTLYDDQGTAVGATTRNLNPHQKLSVTIEDLFPDLPPNTVAGWLSCSAPVPLAGFELFINEANQDQMGALIAQ